MSLGLTFVSQALYAVTCGLVITCCYYGAGQLSADLLPETQMMGTKVSKHEFSSLSLISPVSFRGAGKEERRCGLLPTRVYKAPTNADKLQIQLFFIAEFFYASCTVPIKASICVCLLRIADTRRRFVWTLWAVIGATVSASIIFIVAIANLCHPITTLWGETTDGSCDSGLNSSVSFYFSAVSIVTDWTLAILPGILLWNVQMKRRAKASVAMILSLAAL